MRPDANYCYLLFWLVLLVLISGCTYSVLDTGETLPSNKMSVGMEDSFTYEDGHFFPLFPQLSLRRGLVENLDFGTRILYIGIIGDFKYRLLKEPLTLSLGTGGGYNLFGFTLFEATAYLSKEYNFGTPYMAYRYCWGSGEVHTVEKIDVSANYPVIALGVKLPIVSWLDILCETDAVVGDERIHYFGGLKFNIHSKK